MSSEEYQEYIERNEEELFNEFIDRKGLRTEFENFAYNHWIDYEASKADYMYDQMKDDGI